ncbi:rRNA-processing protein [Martiniozyma asiatica (nom. inval.)]|nr:rRNA-processing protein [Martiniozyma asiatica]
MGKAKKTRKISVKRMVKKNDQRIKDNQVKQKDKEDDKELVRAVPQVSSALFFQYNEAIKPPYQILIDTNFFNFSIQKKIDIVRGMMDCLLAKCIPMVTDCVIAELEKLGPKYRIALTLAKDPRIQRLKCSHKGTYADDCMVSRVIQSKCYIVATNDVDLKRRVRKVPGIPIMSVGGHAYIIERLPDVF